VRPENLLDDLQGLRSSGLHRYQQLAVDEIGAVREWLASITKFIEDFGDRPANVDLTVTVGSRDGGRQH